MKSTKVKKNTDTCNIRYCMDQTRFKNDIH